MDIQTIKFSDDMLTGNEHIDDDHKKITEVFNQYVIGLKQDDMQLCANMISIMETYILNHFAFEMTLVDEGTLIIPPGHLESHREFVETFNHLQLERIGSTGTGIEEYKKIGKFLYQWLSLHMGEVQASTQE